MVYTQVVSTVRGGRAGHTAGDDVLTAMLEMIIKHPGIRPGELNRKLGLSSSVHLRNTLVSRGLVRKYRVGDCLRYYAAETQLRPTQVG